MKQKKLINRIILYRLAFFELIFVFGLLGLVNFVQAQAGCTITNLTWADSSGNSVTSLTVGQTYHPTATWNNCQNTTGGTYGVINIFGPGLGSGTGGSVGTIAPGTDPHWYPITIPQAGSYYFNAQVVGINGAQSQPSATLQAAATGAGSSPSVKADKSSYNIGDTMTLTVSNIPSNVASGQACVNGGAQCFNFNNNSGSATVSIPVTTNEYFQTSGSNSVAVNFFDSSDNFVSSPQGSPLTVTTGATQQTTAVGAPASTPYNCNTPNAQNCLYNPLPEDNLTSTLLLIGKGFLGVIAIWAAVFIIIGGFQLVMSSGNEEMVLKAKKTIMWAVLGLVVALLSFSIIAIVQNLFQANVQPVNTTSTTSGGTPNNIPGGTTNNIPGGTPNNIPNGTSN